MKRFIILLLAGFQTSLHAQTNRLEKIWETDTVVAIPESVLPVPGKDLLYVSLINGGGWDADGKGGVGRISREGKNYDSSWITGLNAPKGLGLFGNRLYAADISEVAVIDISKGKIEKKIAIDGANGLNDITVSDKGVVYVSDSRTSRIWRIERDQPVLYLDSVKGVNGLKALGEDLYIGAGKNFLKADRNRNLTRIVELPQGIDGIEPVGNGDFILTAWAGYIFYVTPSGQYETLADTHDEKMNTADIGYDQVKRILYVPTFNAKKIVAYRLVGDKRSSSLSPRLFILDANRLAELKAGRGKGDKEITRLTDTLLKKANELLAMKPVSVMDKAFTPPSGTKHDYMSQAPYFWYDSTKPKGLPYLRRDGQRNPEINKIADHKNLDDVSASVRLLSLAWYLTGQEKYADKAAGLLRYWFLHADTRMNPHLNYAQGIPGITDGRGIGLIETRSLMGIADAAGLLALSRSWTDADMRSLQQWYSQFLNWMLTSKNGKEEHAAKNNHGSWYYAQAIDYALFTGDKAKARELVEESKKRLDSQLTKEGSWPLELERTNALGYSTFNTQAWFQVARLAEHTGIDLWNYTTPKGASLRTALDFLRPYALGEKPWTWQQISRYNQNEFYTILLQAAKKYKDAGYLEAANRISGGDQDVVTVMFYR